jgi:hypothetical protein
VNKPERVRVGCPQPAWISHPSSSTGTRTTSRGGGGFSCSGGLRPKYADLVLSYRDRLVERFPRKQEEWTPPWQMRGALALVRIGVAAGQFWTDLPAR